MFINSTFTDLIHSIHSVLLQFFTLLKINIQSKVLSGGSACSDILYREYIVA